MTEMNSNMTFLRKSNTVFTFEPQSGTAAQEADHRELL